MFGVHLVALKFSSAYIITVFVVIGSHRAYRWAERYRHRQVRAAHVNLAKTNNARRCALFYNCVG